MHKYAFTLLSLALPEEALNVDTALPIATGYKHMQIRCYRIEPNTPLQPDQPDDLTAHWFEGKASYWVDIEAAKGNEILTLLAPLKLHPLILMHCTDPQRYTRILYFDTVIFFEFPTQAAGAAGHISLIIKADFLLTLHADPTPEIKELARRLRERTLPQGMEIPTLVYRLLYNLIDHDLERTRTLRSAVERLSATVDQQPDDVDLIEITHLKRQVTQYEATFEDQYSCIDFLQDLEMKVLRENNFRQYLRDLLGYLKYADRLMGRLETRLEQAHQHYMIRIQERIQRRINLLSIITSIFMPLTFVAGIYGMNFHFMPELNWWLGYPLVLLLMVGIAGLQLWLFWRGGWFD